MPRMFGKYPCGGLTCPTRQESYDNGYETGLLWKNDQEARSLSTMTAPAVMPIGLLTALPPERTPSLGLRGLTLVSASGTAPSSPAKCTEPEKNG